MKGCARSCLGSLAGCLGIIFAFHFWFEGLGIREDTRVPASIGLGLLATLAISFLLGAVQSMRDRRLLKNALEGVPPVDGQWAGFAGTIRSSSPLTSPLSGQRVVAFKYDIYAFTGSGKNRSKISYYEGSALAPSTISTNLGTYRLLAVPTFDMKLNDVDDATAARNAGAYIEATKFETNDTAKEERQTVEKEWTDDDGNFRRDKQDGTPADLSECKFAEQIIAQGAQVCVLGLYSQTRGGVIPDPNWAKQTRIIVGDGEDGVRSLGRRIVTYIVVGLVLGAACAAIAQVVIRDALSA
jgi:hypothetical protein